MKAKAARGIAALVQISGVGVGVSGAVYAGQAAAV
jgi:hypothetical protein